MAIRKLIVLLILILVPNGLTVNFWSRKMVKIDMLKNCEERQNTAVSVQRQHYIKLHNFYAVSARIVVNEDLPGDQMMIVKATRCNSKEALDTCEIMNPTSLTRVCVLMSQKRQFWSSLLDKIEPHMECPAKKRTYKMTNGTFDIGNLIMFPFFDKYYWKVNVEVYDEEKKKLYLCIRMEGNVVSIV